ncbi:hypothetical protein Tco_0876269 [Tanacetum coccineum]|uniref:Uncharacterized protein n=1 Tax=Tanacetum coccineum TaxID=301880 RepID=A0ABQ5BUY2_9ASTR
MPIPSGITSIRIDSTSGPSVAETCMANIVNLGPVSPSKNRVDEPVSKGVETVKSWGCMDYARTLIDIRADRELKKDMVIVILNVKDDGEVLHTVRVEYVVPTGRVITTVSIKVPTGSSQCLISSDLKKDEYETWAMKMEYWIMNSDHNLWNIVLHGNSRKQTGRDPRGNIMILPPVTIESKLAVNEMTKSIELFYFIKARFGGNEESKKMRKSMLIEGSWTFCNENVQRKKFGFKETMDHGNEKIGEVLMVFFADGSCLFAAGNGSEGVSVVIGVGADGYMNVLVYFSDATGC